LSLEDLINFLSTFASVFDRVIEFKPAFSLLTNVIYSKIRKVLPRIKRENYMSIKEEGYLHDYVAVGLIGAFLGMIIGSLWYQSMTAEVYYAEWGRLMAYLFVSGVFGNLPAGFVAGYLNYRIHKTEGDAMEGFSAGFMAAIAHAILTLFVFATVAMMGDSRYAGSVMTAWVFVFVFGMIFFPIGGFFSGMVESRPMMMPPILKFKFVAAAGAPPPPPAPGAQTCPTCGGQLTYVPQYQRWYCHKCKKYA
jgi:hypothetical protein